MSIRTTRPERTPPPCGIWRLRLALPLACVGAAGAAVSGLPAPPAPGPEPKAWLEWVNDAFSGSTVHNTDDFRTNANALVVHLSPRWLLAADFSMLTKKGQQSKNPSRADELTTSVGYLPIVGGGDGNWWRLGVGAGMRSSGNYGGQNLQNAWHRTVGFGLVKLPYDDAGQRHTEAMGWIHASRLASVHCAGVGRFGAQVEAGGLATTGGETAGDARALGVVLGRHGSLWAGGEWQARAGTRMSAVADVTARDEAGPWFVLGFATGGLYGEFASAGGSRSTGRIGAQWQPDAAHADPDPVPVSGEIGGTLNAYGLGAQVRWSPDWLRGLPTLGERASFLVDYRFGRVPDIQLTGGSLRYNQGILGIDFGAWQQPRAFPDHLGAQPFVQGGIGWRLEGVQTESFRPQFAPSTQSSTVLAGSVGVRQLLIPGRNIATGLSLSLDGWWPLNPAQTPNGNGEVLNHQQPGWTVSARATMLVAW